MKEYERKQLLERVGREGATVGVRIPTEITVDGDTFALREFVLSVQSLDPGDVERDRVSAAKKTLRRERLSRKNRLEEGDLTYEEGEALVESIVGIDRALNALESLGPTDVEAEAEAQEAADQKRWHAFLQKALGRESGGRRTG